MWLPKRDHSCKEVGRKKQRLHASFLTQLLHLHLSTAVLEVTEETLLLILGLSLSLSHLPVTLEVPLRALCVL